MKLRKIILILQLFREHSIIIGKDFIKDISYIRRAMSNICIVDNIFINLIKWRKCVLVYPFYDDDRKFDNSLFQLKTFIIYIYKIFYKEKDLFLIKIILLLKYVEIKNDKYILQKKKIYLTF